MLFLVQVFICRQNDKETVTSQQLQEVQWKYEADKREAESKHAKTVQQLENRVASLDVQNRDLWEVRVGQEASLREARGQLQCRDEEVARLKRDLAGLRQEKVMVETVGSDRDKQVGQVTARLAKVERDLQDKEAQVTRMQEAASRSQEDTRHQEAGDAARGEGQARGQAGEHYQETVGIDPQGERNHLPS